MIKDQIKEDSDGCGPSRRQTFIIWRADSPLSVNCLEKSRARLAWAYSFIRFLEREIFMRPFICRLAVRLRLIGSSGEKEIAAAGGEGRGAGGNK